MRPLASIPSTRLWGTRITPPTVKGQLSSGLLVAESGPCPRLSGDTSAIGYNINDLGQIVGNSGTAIASGALSPQRAALWEKGTVTDIQTLVPAGTLPLTYLTGTINDLGEITINATNPDGSPDALLLVPKL